MEGVGEDNVDMGVEVAAPPTDRWSALPDAVLLLVFEMLDEHSLRQAKMVCRLARDAINRSAWALLSRLMIEERRNLEHERYWWAGGRGRRGRGGKGRGVPAAEPAAEDMHSKGIRAGKHTGLAKGLNIAAVFPPDDAADFGVGYVDGLRMGFGMGFAKGMGGGKDGGKGIGKGKGVGGKGVGKGVGKGADDGAGKGEGKGKGKGKGEGGKGEGGKGKGKGGPALVMNDEDEQNALDLALQDSLWNMNGRGRGRGRGGGGGAAADVV